MGSGTPFFQPGSYGDLVRRSGFVSVLRLENCQEIMMAMGFSTHQLIGSTDKNIPTWHGGENVVQKMADDSGYHVYMYIYRYILQYIYIYDTSREIVCEYR